MRRAARARRDRRPVPSVERCFAPSRRSNVLPDPLQARLASERGSGGVPVAPSPSPGEPAPQRGPLLPQSAYCGRHGGDGQDGIIVGHSAAPLSCVPAGSRAAARPTAAPCCPDRLETGWRPTSVERIVRPHVLAGVNASGACPAVGLAGHPGSPRDWQSVAASQLCRKLVHAFNQSDGFPAVDVCLSPQTRAVVCSGGTPVGSCGGCSSSGWAMVLPRSNCAHMGWQAGASAQRHLCCTHTASSCNRGRLVSSGQAQQQLPLVGKTWQRAGSSTMPNAPSCL